MFKQASKIGLRFRIENGVVVTEDLWRLHLPQLDTLAKSLNKELKEAAEESFIAEQSAVSKLVELRFAIVKEVIADKLAEKALLKEKSEKYEMKQVLLGILASKEQESLQNLSKEDLLKELAELE